MLENQLVYIAVYNADKQQLIGLFKGLNTAAKWVFKGTPRDDYNSLRYVGRAVLKKTTLVGVRFDFKTVARYASKAQVEQLNGKEQLILEPSLDN